MPQTTIRPVKPVTETVDRSESRRGIQRLVFENIRNRGGKMTEKQRRQGQKKADGRTAVPKPVCPKCGEICVRSYTRGNEERKRAYIGSGWACPSKTCDHIIKDLVELEDIEY